MTRAVRTPIASNVFEAPPMDSFHEPSQAEIQVRAKLAEGYTVYLGAACYKVKHGDQTLEFQPFLKRDEMSGRFKNDGAMYATKDADEIARIDGIADLRLKKFVPKVEAN